MEHRRSHGYGFRTGKDARALTWPFSQSIIFRALNVHMFTERTNNLPTINNEIRFGSFDVPISRLTPREETR